MLNEVIHGDALQVLRSLPTHSVDAICSDPPSGINFMGKDWDKDKGGRDKWIDWLADIMSEALRVIKPGGHAFVWALPRTSHWTALSLEYGGWQIRDACVHLFGSGMPKSHDISKAIDRMQGMEREVIGYYDPASTYDGYDRVERIKYTGNVLNGGKRGGTSLAPITAPATPDAQQWSGFGTGLKPSHEIWWLARSPLSEKSIAENVLKHGTGGLNIDKCRVGYKSESDYRNATPGSRTYNPANRNKTTPILSETTYRKTEKNPFPPNSQGRWPANLLLSHTLFCVPLGEKKVKGTAPHGKPTVGIQPKPNNTYNLGLRSGVQHSDPDGTETVQAWDCAPDCPVALLDMQSGNRQGDSVNRKPRKKYATTQYGFGNGTSEGYQTQGYSDEGGASRYFKTFHETPDVPFIYTSKASRSERNKGCEALPVSTNEDTNLLTSSWRTDPRSPNGGYENKPAIPQANNHPTVKPLALCRYLVNLITPPGGIVLDMFCGSGSVLVACVMEGYNYIGVDQDSDYCEIARARLAYATQNAYTCKDNMTI